MGLLEVILGKQNPVAQWAAENSGTLGALGAGIGSGTNLGQGLSNAAQNIPQGKLYDQKAAAQRKADALAETQLNATKTWLQKNRPDLTPMLDMGMSPAQVWEFAHQPQGAAADAPATVQEWEYFNKLPPDQKAQYLRMKRASPYLDIGTGFVQPDPLNPGQTSGGPIVKDNMTPAYDAAVGTANGKVDAENAAAAGSLGSKLPGLKSVVGQLSELAKTATYTQTGQLIDSIVRETGQMPPEGAIARTKYMSIVDNQVLPLLRDTFGAAFTQKEGDSLRATLGNPDVSPPEKQAILEAFIEQKTRDLQALQSRLPGASSSMAPPVSNDPLGLR